jgi:phage internal scaffolding protein
MSKKTGVFLRTPYNYDRNAASKASGLVCQEPTRAQQHHKDECDINVIVRRFGVTGMVPVTALNARYGDFTDAVDYHTAMNQIIAAEADFKALPSDLRARFQNDPAQLLDFLSKKENRAEAESLGLVPKTEGKPSESTAPQTTVTDPQ